MIHKVVVSKFTKTEKKIEIKKSNLKLTDKIARSF